MKLLDSICEFGCEHDDVLFAIGEICLGAAAVIFSAKNTAKYLDERERNPEPETPQDKAKQIAKCYWQTGVCLGGFIALRTMDCVYTQNVKQDYAKALMAAQSALLAKRPKEKKQQQAIAQNDTSNHVEGEEMIEQRDENHYDQYDYCDWFHADELPEPETSVYFNGYGGEELFYIPAIGVLFYSSRVDIMKAETECALQLESGADMTIDEMMKYLGLGSKGNIGKMMYIQGDPEDDEIRGDFSFDLMPACLDYGDGFESMELIWTINPNRYIRNKILA